MTPWTAAHQASLSLTGAYSNSCPSSWWGHPTILSSVIPFSSWLQSFPASGSFPKIHFFIGLYEAQTYSFWPVSVHRKQRQKTLFLISRETYLGREQQCSGYLIVIVIVIDSDSDSVGLSVMSDLLWPHEVSLEKSVCRSRSNKFHVRTRHGTTVKVLEFQLQHQSFQWIFRTDFL